MNSPLLGTTYSYKHAEYLGLIHQEAFNALLDLKFGIIRVATYWNDNQPQENVFDFKRITEMLEVCEKKNQKVLLTVGMKGPRWPEFHLPKWIKDKNETERNTFLFTYLERLIKECKQYKCISHWQVENEPLDPSGPENAKIPEAILRKEIEIVKSLDSRPIIVTAWGNSLTKRQCIPIIAEIADIIGIDIYYKQFFQKILQSSFYMGPLDSDKKIAQYCTNFKKEVWVTELQAEPWEKSMELYKSESPKSFDSQILRNNLQKVLTIDPKAVIFWGYEYWYWKKLQGDPTVWNEVIDILKERSL